MKKLVSNASANIYKTSPKPRLHVRITDIVTDELILDFDTMTKNAGTISRSIPPFGGIETVSDFTVDDLVLADDFRLCEDVTLTNTTVGARRGAGRIISQNMSDYDTARNAYIGSWATPTITVGQQLSASIGYGVYVGYLQVTVPADVTTIEEACIYLKGVSDYSTTDFEIYLVQGTWAALSEEGAMFNDFTGWAASGAYTLTPLNETYNSSEYVTYDADKDDNEAYNLFRLNAAGRQYLIDCAGTVAKFAFVSKNHADNTTPTGNEYINFEASTAMLKIRYNTKTLDNQRARAYRYYEPFTGDYTTMQKIYDGVVDSHALDNQTLSLTIKKSDLKNNVLIPGTVLNAKDYPYIAQANIGKAIPEVYGDFLSLAEHREGIAYVVDENSGEQIAHRDYVKALMYNTWSYKGIIANHAIKAIDTNAALYESGNGVYTLLIANVTGESGEDNKKLALTPRDLNTYGNNEFPIELTNGLMCGIMCFIPQNVNTGGSSAFITNQFQAVNTDTDDYCTLTAGMTQPQWNFKVNSITSARSMGIEPINHLYLCYYTYKEGGSYTGKTTLTIAVYHDGPTDFGLITTSSFTLSANGWHYHEITNIPDNNSLSYLLYIEPGNDETVQISNISLSAGYKVDFKNEFYIACQGRYDDVSGTITGTSEALIENPSHVIESLARNSMSQTAAEIDTSGFDTAATALPNWKLAFQLLDQKKAADILDKIGKQTKTAVFRDDDDKLTVNVWNTDAPFTVSGTDIPAAWDIYADEGRAVNTSGVTSWTRHPIEHDSLTIEQVDSGEVYNSFVLKYRKNYATGEYMEVLTIDNGLGDDATVDTNLETADEAYLEDSQTIDGLKALTSESYTAMGNTTNTLTFKCDYIRDRATAVKLFQHLIEAYVYRRYKVKFNTRENALALERGDIINVRHRRVYDMFGTITSDRKKWMVTKVNHYVRSFIIAIEAIEVIHGA